MFCSVPIPTVLREKGFITVTVWPRPPEEPSHLIPEVTIAGTLQDMFARLMPANDLEFRYGIDAPTVRIDGLTVAGQ